MTTSKRKPVFIEKIMPVTLLNEQVYYEHGGNPFKGLHRWYSRISNPAEEKVDFELVKGRKGKGTEKALADLWLAMDEIKAKVVYVQPELDLGYGQQTLDFGAVMDNE